MPAFTDSEIDDPELLSNAAGEIYRMRRARDRYLPKELTGEPAWDILLALYAEEPAKLPVSSLCFGSGAPQTTALRWIAVLEKSDLIVRTRHTRDPSVLLLALTEQGRFLIERSLKAMLRAAQP